MIFAFLVCFGLKITAIVFERKKGTMNPELSAWKQVLLEMLLHIQKGSVGVCIICGVSQTELCSSGFGHVCLFVCLPAGSACGRASESGSGEEGECRAGLQHS